MGKTPILLLCVLAWVHGGDAQPLSDLQTVLQDHTTKLEEMINELQKLTQVWTSTRCAPDQEGASGAAGRVADGTPQEEKRSGPGLLMNPSHMRQVAFTASLGSTYETTVGPYPEYRPLIYGYVMTNVGNAYNSTTGVFTAPIKGVYHFEFFAAGRGRTAVILMKNGKRTYSASKHAFEFSTTGNAGTLLLEAGDRMSLTLTGEHSIYDSASHHSTFSGHLLFAM